jgi:hypothetical protein
MLWDVDIGWLLMAFGTVAGISYMLALTMESSIGREGFGPFGNAGLITTGFFLGILSANYQGVSFSELKYALMVGMVGSFALMLFMFVLRGVWARF